MKKSRGARTPRSGQREPAHEERGKESPLKSPKTPRKRPIDDELVGKEIICPGDVFATPGQDYRGIVTGSSKPQREKRLWVKFEDGSQYWFPKAEVVKWQADPHIASSQEVKPETATDAPTSTPRVRQRKKSASRPLQPEPSAAAVPVRYSGEEQRAEPSGVERQGHGVPWGTVQPLHLRHEMIQVGSAVAIFAAAATIVYVIVPFIQHLRLFGS
eukprot:jgi/Botrbrau1/1039/Bobra.0076s0009.2